MSKEGFPDPLPREGLLMNRMAARAGKLEFYKSVMEADFEMHLTYVGLSVQKLGVVHILRNHGWGGRGSPQMITDYIGGVWPNDYRLHRGGLTK